MKKKNRSKDRNKDTTEVPENGTNVNKGGEARTITDAINNKTIRVM